MLADLTAKLDALRARGVTILDPRQVYLDEHVDVRRICPDAVLHPGTRLLGARTFLGPGCRIGTEGPAVLEDCVVGENVEVSSGYLKQCVMLRDSRIGPCAHVRPGTLLEEEASTAHAVGLKHTVLMCFVTLGSLINLCDALISGGTSRKDHSEVGSGFIHFNFTPWGDKATPSLVGDVVHGVFLRQPRIFLGGMSGLVGPQKVGFGSFTVAGQIIRKEVPPGRIVCELPREVDKPFPSERPKRNVAVLKKNLEYIGQLYALRAWYESVRLARIPATVEYEHLRVVISEASRTLSTCIEERAARLQEFLRLQELSAVNLQYTIPPCPLRFDTKGPYVDHVQWVRSLGESEVQAGISWLESIVQSCACP